MNPLRKALRPRSYVWWLSVQPLDTRDSMIYYRSRKQAWADWRSRDPEYYACKVTRAEMRQFSREHNDSVARFTQEYFAALIAELRSPL